MPRADFTFSYRKRVRFAEIDAQAVLFNSRYLEYFDIGLVEYWRAAGMYETGGMHETGGMVGDGPDFHVAKALVEFRAPILLDEQVDICVRCARIGTSSMQFCFELHGVATSDADMAGLGTDDLRATGEEVHVHVAAVRGRPTPLPPHVIALFETYEGRSLREGVAA